MVLLEEIDQDLFRQWLRPNLESISDVDTGVLADYVVALILENNSEAGFKQHSTDGLSDFLHNDTPAFVDKILKALLEKSYAPAPSTSKSLAEPQGKHASPAENPTQNAPIPSIVGATNVDYEPRPPSWAPTGPNLHRSAQPPNGSQLNNVGQSSRKRKSLAEDTVMSGVNQPYGGQDPHYIYESGNRPSKQTARRGGAQSRGRGGMVQNGANDFPAALGMYDLANLPPPPPGPLPFDPSIMIQFMQAMGANLANLPQMPTPTKQKKKKGRCKDFYNRGICSMGTMCPYDHGGAVAVPADEVPEYDPDNAALVLHGKGNKRTKKRDQSKAARKGGRKRASMSLVGPSLDPTNSTLVVEQIPGDKFNEEDIRAFFAEFGDIYEITLHKPRCVAVLEFKSREDALKAYNSHKPVFDNRFVKVYWHTSEVEMDLASRDAFAREAEEENQIDPDEVAQRQAEKQKAFEDRKKREEEVAARAEEVERRLKDIDAQIREMREQIVALGGDESEVFTQSLAMLQAEAENLFAQHDAPEAAGGHPRGGYGAPRGRGAWRARGRGRPSMYPGRSSVKRLDNRPRRLAVSGVEPGSRQDEVLREHLLNTPGCANVDKHPEHPTALLITFKERYHAEMFLDASLRIPGLEGSLDLSWVPNDAFGGISSMVEVSGHASGAGDGERDSSATVEGHDEEDAERERGAEEKQIKLEEQDMDVADDVDQWL